MKMLTEKERIKKEVWERFIKDVVKLPKNMKIEHPATKCYNNLVENTISKTSKIILHHFEGCMLMIDVKRKIKEIKKEFR